MPNDAEYKGIKQEMAARCHFQKKGGEKGRFEIV
jgi:hypothetical protein